MLTLESNPTIQEELKHYYITCYNSNGKKFYIYSLPIDDPDYEEKLSSMMNYQYYYGEPNYF